MGEHHHPGALGAVLHGRSSGCTSAPTACRRPAGRRAGAASPGSLRSAPGSSSRPPARSARGRGRNRVRDRTVDSARVRDLAHDPADPPGPVDWRNLPRAPRFPRCLRRCLPRRRRIYIPIVMTWSAERYRLGVASPSSGSSSSSRDRCRRRGGAVTSERIQHRASRLPAHRSSARLADGDRRHVAPGVDGYRGERARCGRGDRGRGIEPAEGRTPSGCSAAGPVEHAALRPWKRRARGLLRPAAGAPRGRAAPWRDSRVARRAVRGRSARPRCSCTT